MWSVVMVFDRIDVAELAEGFGEPVEINRSPARVLRRRLVFEKKALEENAMSRRWRDGMGLEKIHDLSHVLFISIFRTGNIPTPVAGIPEFHAVVEADQDDLLLFIHRDQLS